VRAGNGAGVARLGREDDRGRHHRAGLVLRRAAAGDQGRRSDRRAGGAAGHQRADCGSAGQRPGRELVLLGLQPPLQLGQLPRAQLGGSVRLEELGIVLVYPRGTGGPAGWTWRRWRPRASVSRLSVHAIFNRCCALLYSRPPVGGVVDFSQPEPRSNPGLRGPGADHRMTFQVSDTTLQRPDIHGRPRCGTPCCPTCPAPSSWPSRSTWSLFGG
jgi:hypothetical protein